MREIRQSDEWNYEFNSFRATSWCNKEPQNWFRTMIEFKPYAKLLGYTHSDSLDQCQLIQLTIKKKFNFITQIDIS